MCGFAGSVARSPHTLAVGADALRGAQQALAHRGPDACGEYFDMRAGLVHTRLCVIDPSEGGAQPMRDAGTGVVLVYNGEIYNFPELRRELSQEPFHGRNLRVLKRVLTTLDAWAQSDRQKKVAGNFRSRSMKLCLTHNKPEHCSQLNPTSGDSG